MGFESPADRFFGEDVLKILDPGHKYELEVYDAGNPDHTEIAFLKREGKGFPFNKGSFPGTNCQEVLRALIDRTEYLNKQVPCAETEAIIAQLKAALFLFESRAARVHDKTLSLSDLGAPVRNQVCNICGHLKEVCVGH